MNICYKQYYEHVMEDLSDEEIVGKINKERNW